MGTREEEGDGGDGNDSLSDHETSKRRHGMMRVRLQHEQERDRKHRLDDILDEYDRELAMPVTPTDSNELGSGEDSTDTVRRQSEGTTNYEAGGGSSTAEGAAAAATGEVIRKRKKGRRSKGSNDAKDIEQKKESRAAGSGT